MTTIPSHKTGIILTLLAAYSLILSGCGSSNGGSAASGGSASGGGGSLGSTDKGSCSATVTGAATDTVACVVTAFEDPSGTTTFEIASVTGAHPLTIIDFKGDPADKSYAAATVFDAASFYQQSISVAWQEDASLGVETSGTFALTLTNPGMSQSLGSQGETWTGMHGTFTGTLPPAGTGSTATGTVMLDIAF